jgi:hypothetical protein
MASKSDAYDGACPSCGHVFMLADLRRMAVGDGWQRWIRVRLPNNTEALVAFDDFDPQTMTALPQVRPPGGD